MTTASASAERAAMFDCLCQIGEIAGILLDIAAREISENKPIAGTAIDMLARMIEGQVQRGMNDPGEQADDADDLTPLADAADRLRAELSRARRVLERFAENSGE